MTPFAAAMLAWQAGTVFTLRSQTMWSDPARAQLLLTQYAMEKQRAFAVGTAAAGRAALAGADPAAVLQAALLPAHRRLRANHRALTRRR
jgi:hypothetical protein